MHGAAPSVPVILYSLYLQHASQILRHHQSSLNETLLDFWGQVHRVHRKSCLFIFPLAVLIPMCTYSGGSQFIWGLGKLDTLGTCFSVGPSAPGVRQSKFLPFGPNSITWTQPPFRHFYKHIPNPHWGNFYQRWDQDMDHFTQLAHSSRQGVLPLSDRQVNTFRFSYWTGSLFAIPICLNWHHVSVPTHTLCKNSKKANAGIHITPTHAITDLSLTNSRKQQESPVAMPVATQRYLKFIFI